MLTDQSPKATYPALIKVLWANDGFVLVRDDRRDAYKSWDEIHKATMSDVHPGWGTPYEGNC